MSHYKSHFSITKLAEIELGTLCIKHCGRNFMFDYSYNLRTGELIILNKDISPFFDELIPLFPHLKTLK